MQAPCKAQSLRTGNWMSLPAADREGNTQCVPKGGTYTQKATARLFSAAAVKLNQPTHSALSCRDVGKEGVEVKCLFQVKWGKGRIQTRQPGSTLCVGFLLRHDHNGEDQDLH